MGATQIRARLLSAALVVMAALVAANGLRRADAQPGHIEIDARIVGIWPHENADGTTADRATVTAYLFQAGTVLPFCDPSIEVHLLAAAGYDPPLSAAMGRARLVSEGDQAFYVWDFEDVDISPARDLGHPSYLTVSARPDGSFMINSNVWTVGGAGSGRHPDASVPAAVAPLVGASEPRIEMVWAHDSDGALDSEAVAQLVNIRAAVFLGGTERAVAAEYDGDLTLLVGQNLEPMRAVATGEGRLETTANEVVFPVWDFNNIDVSAALDPANTYFFQVRTDRGELSNVWAYGGDGETAPEQVEPPLGSCPSTEVTPEPTPTATVVQTPTVTPTPTVTRTSGPSPSPTWTPLPPLQPDEVQLGSENRLPGWGMLLDVNLPESMRQQTLRVTVQRVRYEEIRFGVGPTTLDATGWPIGIYRLPARPLRPGEVRVGDCRYLQPGDDTPCLIASTYAGNPLLWGIVPGRYYIVFDNMDDRSSSRRLQSVRFRVDYPNLPAPTVAPTFTPRPTSTPRPVGARVVAGALAAPMLVGMDYAKDPAAAPRDAQAELMVAAACTCTRDGIDLANVWTGPNEMDWEVGNPDSGGLTYDAVVDLSLARGIQVFGMISTTPWWALELADAGSASASGETTLVDASRHWRVDQWANENYEIRLVAGTGAGQTRPIASNAADTLVLRAPWETWPDATSRYEIKGVAHRWAPAEGQAEAFERACRDTAAHFRGRITWWEFWNEQNLLGWHSSEPAEYTTWLIRCARGIKKGNPDARVALGGLDGNTDFYQRDVLDYVDQVRASGGQPWYDGIAIHPYGQLDSPLLDTDDLDLLRANMDRYGDGAKPILVSEWGAWLGQDDPILAARIKDGIAKLRAGDWNVLMAAYSPQSGMEGVLAELCT